MIIRSIAVIIAFLILHSSFCQSYSTAVGVRMGTAFGLTARQLVAKKLSIEGILQSEIRTDQSTASVLVLAHKPLIFRNANIFMGGGIFAGWLNQPDEISTFREPWGVTCMAGAELSIGRFNLSWDYKPAYNIRAELRPFSASTSVSFRYILEKRAEKKKRQRKRKRAKKKRMKAKEKQK